MRDYKVVQRLKDFGQFDYRDLAYILHDYIELLQGGFYPTQQIEIAGSVYSQQFKSYNSGQACPWEDCSVEDGAMNSRTEILLTNATTNHTRHVSSLLPHLIDEHWFFEGNPLYRVAPEEIVFLSLSSTQEQKDLAVKVGLEFPL